MSSLNNLLHIDSSILGDRSASRTLTAAIVAHLRARHPALEVTHHDLAAAPLPHLTQADWLALTDGAEVREFMAADVVVIGAGFYNFTIPSQLKAWIDRIVVMGQTCAYSDKGPIGLCQGKRVIVALAKGGVYQAGSPFAPLEHAETLLRGIFTTLGCEVEFINAEGLAFGDEARQAAIDQALARIGQLELEPVA